MRLQRPEPAWMYAAVAAIVCTVFVLDLFAPLGVACWILHAPAVIVCKLATWRRNAPLAVAGVASALVVAGYFASDRPTAMAAELAALNRGIGIATLLALGIMGRQFVAHRTAVANQAWREAGQIGLSRHMSGEQTPAGLGSNVLAYLADYVGAQVGAIYAADDTGSFRRCAAFARTGELADSREAFAPGEGLVGQAALAEGALVVDDVPAGYAQVRSGVGAAPPRTLVLVPARADGEVDGVLELGFFRPPGAEVRAFLATVAESIGIAFRTARYRAQQAELLAQTQRQAEELQAQQEELRRNNEELDQQAESLRESQVRLENQQTELEEANTQLEEQALALESQREDLLATQAALQQQAAELGRASRYKSEFLANMSHELRTPLNSSLILAKLLMDNRGGNLTTDQVQYATSIHAAGNDLLALIDDILDLSKIEAGRVDLAIEPVATARIVDELAHRFGPLAAERGLDLRTEVQPGCPERLETDAQRLRQVLTNLLANALKFTHAGGISLRAGPRSPRRIAFTVEDTGVGIAAEQHEVIFEAFRQADGTTHRKYGGTGLGLSICRELVTLLGGEIELASAPGEGSAFTVVLPVRSERTARRAAPATPRPPVARPPLEPAAERSPFVEDDRGAPGERVVLIVEDDPAFARILRDLGRELAFRCIVARDAAEGLALARAHHPVAVVLDVGLPDHSGLTVLELMKRDPATRHVPIHVVSGHDHEKVARELGAVGYALKPVDRDRLVAAFRVLEERLSRTVKAVLVVEDDPVQRDAITRLLRADGVDIVAVGTGEAALERLRTTTFDCCVLDLMLPDVSGFELLDRMSADGSCSFPPVIVHTARALTADEEQRLRRSSSSIIVKGARSPERLLEEITLFLHKVESELPAEQRRMLAAARDRDRVFDGRSVLLVEDDVRTIFALAQALELRGLEVQIARNGKEALARLDKGGIDVVLMDVMMPEMDGLAAMRAIRADGRWGALPVLALTAKAMPDDRRDCLQAGANDYVAKPIDVDKLMSLLRVWMPR